MNTFEAMGALIFNDDGKPRLQGETYDLSDEKMLILFIRLSTQIAYAAGRVDAQTETRRALGITGFGSNLRVDQ